MIFIYNKNEKIFDNNGYGILKDVISCYCSEELNGKYDLELTYSTNGLLSEYLLEENIIKADVGNMSGEPQLFRIKLIQRDLKRITIYATHIFYDLADNFLLDIAPTDKNGNSAINWILDHSETEHDFIGTSNVENIKTARYVKKNIVESIISSENSFINTWGGELYRNNKEFSIDDKIGVDKNIKIMYGKNLKEIDWQIDITGVVTRVYPIGFNGITILENYIDSQNINNYVNPKIAKIDYSDIAVDEEKGITLEIAQQKLIESVLQDFENGIDQPLITVNVDFVELSKTDEYQEKYSNFEKVYIGDYVEANVEYLNFKEMLKVVGTTYDVLAQKYIEFTLSNQNKYKGSYNKTINETLKKLNDNDTNVLNSAKESATNLIKNAMGGYVYKSNNELFIMNTDNPNTAQQIWRWNLNGLGYSSTGLSGPYELAMTMDGRIVANFITTGEMSVDRITGLADALHSLSLDIDGFKFDVQNSGGSNLIKNSVGYADFQNWNKTGNVETTTNTELLTNGSKSGSAFVFNEGKILQKINVKADDDAIPLEEKTRYTFSTIIKKGLLGNCCFKIYNDLEEYNISLLENEESFYKEYVIKGVLPKQSFYFIEIYGSEDSNSTFTDNMCNVGNIKTPYQQATNEILNTQVNINDNGVLVKSNVYKGNYTIMSPLEFAGYANVSGTILRVFSLNGDTTEVEKLKTNKEISMDPIKIITRKTGSKPGWYWAKSTGGGQ